MVLLPLTTGLNSTDPVMTSRSPVDQESSGEQSGDGKQPTNVSIIPDIELTSEESSSAEGKNIDIFDETTAFEATTFYDNQDVEDTSSTYTTSIYLLSAVFVIALLTIILFFGAMMWYKTHKKASYYVNELKEYDCNTDKEEKKQSSESLIEETVMNVCDVRGKQEWLV